MYLSFFIDFVFYLFVFVSCHGLSIQHMQTACLYFDISIRLNPIATVKCVGRKVNFLLGQFGSRHGQPPPNGWKKWRHPIPWTRWFVALGLYKEKNRFQSAVDICPSPDYWSTKHLDTDLIKHVEAWSRFPEWSDTMSTGLLWRSTPYIPGNQPPARRPPPSYEQHPMLESCTFWIGEILFTK